MATALISTSAGNSGTSSARPCSAAFVGASARMDMLNNTVPEPVQRELVYSGGRQTAWASSPRQAAPGGQASCRSRPRCSRGADPGTLQTAGQIWIWTSRPALAGLARSKRRARAPTQPFSFPMADSARCADGAPPCRARWKTSMLLVPEKLVWGVRGLGPRDPCGAGPPVDRPGRVTARCRGAVHAHPGTAPLRMPQMAAGEGGHPCGRPRPGRGAQPDGGGLHGRQRHGPPHRGPAR